MTYRLTPRAKRGLQSIILYTEARFGSQVAERTFGKLTATFERIAAQPGGGHLRSDLTDAGDVRFWSAGPTLLAYRKVGQRVESCSSNVLISTGEDSSSRKRLRGATVQSRATTPPA